jgi:XTP/dITP diphosphohydrolase
VRLLVATSNPGKLREVREILGAVLSSGHALVSLADLGIEPPEETGSTFAQNAMQKATAAALRSGLWALGDDSGLCVDALDGAPGIRSARYDDTEESRRQKVLRLLAAVPAPRRGAQFVCAVALSSPDGRRLFRAEAQMNGRIALAPRGQNGFGYDPIFEADDAPGQTVAELPQEEKNRLSHRGRALAQLRPALAKVLAAEG